MTFKTALTSCTALRNAYCSGLQAMRGDSEKVDAHPSKHLRGSVHIDAALQDQLPDEPRWDYGIGWYDSRLKREVAIWLEVHPADSGHVQDVLNKKKWLQDWLRSNGPQLLKMTRRQEGFVWLATNAVSLTKNGPAAKRLAQAGVSFPRRKLRLR